VSADDLHVDYMNSLDSIDSMDVDSAMLNPDIHFFVVLRYALLALQLLPENSISGRNGFLLLEKLFHFLTSLCDN